MDILSITEKPKIDQSFEKYEYHSYEPITCTDQAWGNKDKYWNAKLAHTSK